VARQVSRVALTAGSGSSSSGATGSACRSARLTSLGKPCFEACLQAADDLVDVAHV
jgi:hypothetical protein